MIFRSGQIPDPGTTSTEAPRCVDTRYSLAPLVVLLFGLALPSCPAAATDIGVETISMRVVNEVYVVDAALRCTLSEESIQALESGVPITFAIEITLKRKRDFLWDSVVTTLRQQYRVQHHALSEQHLLVNLATGTSRSFSTLDDTLDAFEHLTAIPLIEADKLDPNEVYIGQMRASLDIEALPTPMRPLAYLSPEWWMSSHWHQWEVRP
ncbi:MAG: DUF4390 domain-containing protein [Gammaproteobacteria bacterium]